MSTPVEEEIKRVLCLNEKQEKIVVALKNYIQNTDILKQNQSFLLLGPAGSGKSTVIVNAFNDPVNYRIAFCAFTNKASQVLKDITKKFPSAQNFLKIATFDTIHSFLRLKPKYVARQSTRYAGQNEKKTIEFELQFTMDKKKLEHLLEYKIIIFDECSTISEEVFNFITEAVRYMRDYYEHAIHVIYLGDYWQLPPVGEELSLVFKLATRDKWPIGKLTVVERAQNNTLREINARLLKWTNILSNYKLEENMIKINDFYLDYPFNLLPRKTDTYVSELDKLDKVSEINDVNKLDESDAVIAENYAPNCTELYFNLVYGTRDTDDKRYSSIIITYSVNNCRVINEDIQNMIDSSNKRARTYGVKFNVGDRCCIDAPIDLREIVIGANGYAQLGKEFGRKLYNGESYEIIDVMETKVMTCINDIKYNISAYFDCQILTVSRPLETVREKIIFIKKETIVDARKKLYATLRKKDYEDIITGFLKHYPMVDYGYAMTIYKAQGSEWNYVFVNFNSIKYSLLWNHKENRLKMIDEITISDIKRLFRASYTALTRARIRVCGFRAQ